MRCVPCKIRPNIFAEEDAMATERPGPYIRVTWLTRGIKGARYEGQFRGRNSGDAFAVLDVDFADRTTRRITRQ